MRQPELSIFQIGRTKAIQEGILAAALMHLKNDSLLLFTDTEASYPQKIEGAECSFTPIPSYGIHRYGKDIAGFGDMELLGPQLSQNSPVAIKRVNHHDILPTEEWDAEQAIEEEYAISEEIKNSQAPPFMYQGVIKKQSGFLIITRYEENVVSFDPQIQKFDPESIETALSYAATTLIVLHSNNIVHDNLIIENTAHDIDSGKARTIDLSFSRHTENVTHFMKNIKDYIKSTSRYYPIVGKIPVTVDMINDRLIDPYVDTISQTIPSSKQSQFIAGLVTVRKSIPTYLSIDKK